MGNKKGWILFLVLSLILINLGSVFADGGYFPPPGYWVRPGEQRAIIFHEDNTETLILTSGFQGNAKDLVWIIPTPTKPEITKANEEIFTNVAKLAQPKYEPGGFGYKTMMLESAADVGRVLVLESKKVDYYDVNIVFAVNSEDLVEWFNQNNYSYPEEYSYVLNHYISKGWFFTTIKVSPEAQGATEVIQDLKEGHPTPIKMVFLSEKILFPLKISSVEFKPDEEVKENYYYRYENYIPINLYVITDNKYEADNFNTQYGNWVEKEQIEDLGDDSNGDPFLQPREEKYYLTHLYADMQKSQMDDDVFLKKADDNNKVNAGPELWQVFLYGLLIGVVIIIVWVFTPLGLMFIAGSLILFLSSNKGARIFGWIMEWISLVVTFLIVFLFLWVVAIERAFDSYVVISFLISIGILIIIMVLLMLKELKHSKRNIVK